MSTSTRVVKNTVFLYLRTGFSILTSLLSTRFILEALGAMDYGIYTVVGGSIGLMGFFNATLSNANQRFMSHSLGRGDGEMAKKVFNVSIFVHLVIGFITVICLLSLINVFFSDILNIPTSRIHAAHVIFYCLIISTFFNILNVPYEAMVTAHEDMGYYTVVGFIDSSLKLGISILCLLTSSDKLILYGVCMGSLPLLSFIILKTYCHKRYSECVISPHKYFDKSILKSMAGFSGWNFLTAISHIGTLQGMGLVLNHFYGTVLNASQAISNQVNAVFSNFSSNMTKALNPVITKKNSKGEIASMNQFSLTGSKYSCFLFLLFGIPVTVNIQFILKIWLVNVPDWTATFCVMQFINGLFCQLTSAIATSIYASGKIKNYAIYKSLFNILPLFAIYLAFKLDGSPLWLYIPMIVLWGLGGDAVIIYYAKKECRLSVLDFFRIVAIPVAGCAFIMWIFGASMHLINASEIFVFIFSTLLSVVGFLIYMLLFGISSSERVLLFEMWQKIRQRVLRKCV